MNSGGLTIKMANEHTQNSNSINVFTQKSISFVNIVQHSQRCNTTIYLLFN